MAQKKTFEKELATNPALEFISSAQEETQPRTEETPDNNQPRYKRNYAVVEVKSKRVQLLVQPTLYQRLKEIATAEGRSVNDYINGLIEKAVRRHH